MSSSSSTVPTLPTASPRRVRARDAQDSDRRLRLALGLGVAAGPGAGDADLCRPCAGAAAVRARGLSQAARAAVQLCRASPDRATDLAASERRRGQAARRGARRCCWCCRAAAAARFVTTWRISAGRWGGSPTQGVAFEPILPTMPHLQEAVADGMNTWPVQPRVVIGEQEKRAAFRIAHAALANPAP